MSAVDGIVAKITPDQARALVDALKPIVHLALDHQERADMGTMMQRIAAGAMRLHVATLLSAGPAEIVVAVTDGSTTHVLARYQFDGGGLTVGDGNIAFN